MIKWRTEDPTEFASIDDAIFAIVETNKGAEYFICRIDKEYTLVDLEYGDDYGWQAEDVDKWCFLDDILESARAGSDNPLAGEKEE